MKLFDLLKALNSGAAADPDAALSSPDHQAADGQRRDQMLGELRAILTLLDSPSANHSPTTESTPSIMPTRPALNLADIFDESSDEGGDKNAATPPLQFMPVDSAAEQPAPRAQLVQSLLEELLPALEQALDHRLQQLDSTTLRELERALLKDTG